MIYMLLQSGMFHYMLAQLHAYYVILHEFTINSMQLQALHANPVGPRDFEILLAFLAMWPMSALFLTPTTCPLKLHSLSKLPRLSLRRFWMLLGESFFAAA